MVAPGRCLVDKARDEFVLDALKEAGALVVGVHQCDLLEQGGEQGELLGGLAAEARLERAAQVSGYDISC